MPDPQFWRGKRVLVTGHTGFKGSWLSLWLQALGADVLGFALPPPTEPSMFADAHVATGMSSREGDTRSAEDVRQALRDHEPEIVLHLASQSLVRQSYDDPVDTYTTNVLGALNVLMAIKTESAARAVVIVTSDKCYENREWYWGYREHERLGGHDPYSSSKACVEIMTSSLRHSFFSAEGGVAIATARAGNVIGGGDWSADRLLPDVMRALIANEAPQIRSPAATRPWQHVLEPLCGYLVLAESLYQAADFAEAWNFGPAAEDAKPVGWIVERITALWGATSEWQLQSGNHPYESTFLKLDASKAHARLGWQPRLPIWTALEWLVDWYRGYSHGADVRTIADAQIREYSEIEPDRGGRDRQAALH